MILVLIILGRKLDFLNKSELKPKWWPKDHPFRNIRNNKRKCLLAILEGYKTRNSEKRDDLRDRSPLASPEKTNIVFDDIVSSDLDDIVSSDLDDISFSEDHPKQVDLEFFYSDPPSCIDESLSDILPPSSPKYFFPILPETPVKETRILQGNLYYFFIQ